MQLKIFPSSPDPQSGFYEFCAGRAHFEEKYFVMAFQLKDTNLYGNPFEPGRTDQ